MPTLAAKTETHTANTRNNAVCHYHPLNTRHPLSGTVDGHRGSYHPVCGSRSSRSKSYFSVSIVTLSMNWSTSIPFPVSWPSSVMTKASRVTSSFCAIATKTSTVKPPLFSSFARREMYPVLTPAADSTSLIFTFLVLAMA